MNLSLFVSMLKTNGKTISSYALGSVLYLLLAIWIYPTIADSEALNEVMLQMPESYLSAFGFEGGMPQDLGGYLAGQYYSMLFVLILMIYCVITAPQLMARLVDRGSMAYLLSASTSRTRIAITQASILVLGLLMIALLTTIGGLVGSYWIIEESNLDVSPFVQMNLVGFLLYFVVSGYSFFFSCLFNDEKLSLAVSGVLSVSFFALHLISKISPDLEWMQNITLFSAFQPSEISKGTFGVLPVSLSLGISGFLLYMFAVIIFNKRDLPL
jgi:ABC-2 type transport system permease protein